MKPQNSLGLLEARSGGPAFFDIEIKLFGIVLWDVIGLLELGFYQSLYMSRQKARDNFSLETISRHEVRFATSKLLVRRARRTDS